MKENCHICGSKMDYTTKRKRQGFQIIIHREDFCPKCKDGYQSTIELPNDWIKEIRWKLQDVQEYLKINIYFVILLATISGLAAISMFYYLPLIEPSRLENTANIILSAIIQSNLALIGLILVAITFAWNRSQNDMDKLERLRNEALEILTGTNIINNGMEPNTIIEYAVEEYYNYYKDDKRKTPEYQPEKVFELYGQLLYTVSYYRPHLCRNAKAYKMVEEFIAKNTWRVPLHNDYSFFICFNQLYERLVSRSGIGPVQQILERYKALNIDNNIYNKLSAISFYKKLTGNLFKLLLFLLITNTMLSVFSILAPQLIYSIFAIIIGIFAVTLIVIFKIIINVIDEMK